MLTKVCAEAGPMSVKNVTAWKQGNHLAAITAAFTSSSGMAASGKPHATA
jgi:hypothetical protein